jgi:hypothetical protein
MFWSLKDAADCSCVGFSVCLRLSSSEALGELLEMLDRLTVPVVYWDVAFLNDKRPGLLYLFAHFALNLLRNFQEEDEGSVEAICTLPGKIWATPGAYLRQSMLTILA